MIVSASFHCLVCQADAFDLVVSCCMDPHVVITLWVGKARSDWFVHVAIPCCDRPPFSSSVKMTIFLREEGTMMDHGEAYVSHYFLLFNKAL